MDKGEHTEVSFSRASYYSDGLHGHLFSCPFTDSLVVDQQEEQDGRLAEISRIRDLS